MVRHATTATKRQTPTEPSQAGAPLAPDAKRALTAAVAQELHKIHGGNEVLDWLEAEILVQGVLERGARDRA